jgi:hypothetical protein
MTDKATDNYKGFPARMSDGRFMTNYQPNCLMNKNNNSYQYRQELISNAEKIMAETDEVNKNRYGCSDCSKIVIPETKNYQDCWGPTCLIDTVNPGGIGIDNVNKQ